MTAELRTAAAEPYRRSDVGGSAEPPRSADLRRAAEIRRPAEIPAAGASIHLMGVGGAGMRGLAVLLAGRGYRVSGCDRSILENGTRGTPAASLEADELTRAGVVLRGGHDPAHVADADLVIHSSAIPADHVELDAARSAGTPILKRARALAALLEDRRVAAIAGTHGKTTITAMLGLALTEAGLDPTVLVGGRVRQWSGNARAGTGPAAVEADEFDRSFLDLNPSLALVSALEAEHLESYGSFDALRAAYVEFAGRAAGRDGVLLCADDPGAASLANDLARGATGAPSTPPTDDIADDATRMHTYGFAADADYRIEPLSGGATGMAGGTQRSRWRLHAPEGQLEFALAIPGRHNAQNAAGALAAALRLGAEPNRLSGALDGFGGVERRLETLGRRGEVVVVDDYAHHPTEVRASLSALRAALPEARLTVVFQPHLYSRTAAMYREFGRALETADLALVLPVYPAREAPLPGVESALIVDAAGPSVRAATPLAALSAIGQAAAGGHPEVWVFMGAGDVTDLARDALEGLS